VQNWINEIKSKTTPSIIPEIEVVLIEEKEIVCIGIKEYPVKPVSTRGRCYKRIHNSNHLLSVAQISDLYMLSMQYSWDSYPFAGASTGSLDVEKINQFIQKVNTIKRFSLPNNPMVALEKLKMVQNGNPTNAAMILFSKENLFYNVHIGRFKTPSTIIADKIISGNLYDVLEESMQTIIGHIKFAVEITGKTTQHTEIPEYPLDAIREALTNALIHRDYQSSTDIQIKIFDQSISFFNPSGLYGNITVKDLATDSYSASTRNKLIAEAFYLTNDIEKYGSGFIRIRKAITEYPTMNFAFRNTAYGFFTEFSYTEQKISTKSGVAETTRKTTQKTTQKILILLRENPNASRKELALMLGNISENGIKYHLNKLSKEKIITRIGPDKGGHWEIMKSEK
jgi:ATP-dependent DNA helicase RecG